MLQQLIEMMREVIENDEIFKVGAQMMKKTYDALLEEGFTEEQAILIVAHQGSGIKTS